MIEPKFSHEYSEFAPRVWGVSEIAGITGVDRSCGPRRAMAARDITSAVKTEGLATIAY
jgi:hypothetical protein